MTKLSDLSALTGASVDAANDLIPVADMSETGIARSKKMTFAELLVGVGAIPSSYLDTDDTLAADSDTKVATQQAVKAYVDGAVAGASGIGLPLTFNFTDAGDAYFYADVAMTLTQQATTGSGSVSYEKGTTAAPDTFTSTSSPISLQAGAWLKVTADDAVAVHLKRTA